MKQDDLKLTKGLKWSVFGHALLALLILGKRLIFPDQVQIYIPTLRVDLVGLPDILKKDLKPSQKSQFNQDIAQVLKKAERDANRIKTTKPTPIKELAKKDEMVLKPSLQHDKTVEKRNQKALNRLKALAKIQEFRDKTDTSSVQHILIKGNQISPGLSLSGDAKEASEAHYYDILRDRLLENWTLPPWIGRQNFDAQVQIYINAQGKLQRLKFLKPSGSSQFDNLIKRTIDLSQPFPFPPQELKTSLLTHGILIGFPL